MLQRHTSVTIACLLLAGTMAASAQKQSPSVRYLRAALGAVRDRTRLTVEAVYAGPETLKETRGRYLGGAGYARFTIVEPTGEQSLNPDGGRPAQLFLGGAMVRPLSLSLRRERDRKKKP